MKKNAIAGLALVAGLAVAGYGAMTWFSPSSNAENAAPAEPVAATVTETGAFIGDVPIGGNGDEVTIIEYASLTCPHCASFHRTIYKDLKADYIDPGKVRFIYRDYPLDNFAMAATMIARCGGEKKYLGFIDLFLDKQDQWRTAPNVLEELKKLAKLGGLGSDKIDACLEDKALGQAVLEAARTGQDEFDVNSTPSVVINGEKYEGPMSSQGLSAYIDDLLDG